MGGYGSEDETELDARSSRGDCLERHERATLASAARPFMALEAIATRRAGIQFGFVLKAIAAHFAAS